MCNRVLSVTFTLYMFKLTTRCHVFVTTVRNRATDILNCFQRNYCTDIHSFLQPCRVFAFLAYTLFFIVPQRKKSIGVKNEIEYKRFTGNHDFLYFNSVSNYINCLLLNCMSLYELCIVVNIRLKLKLV